MGRGGRPKSVCQIQFGTVAKPMREGPPNSNE